MSTMWMYNIMRSHRPPHGWYSILVISIVPLTYASNLVADKLIIVNIRVSMYDVACELCGVRVYVSVCLSVWYIGWTLYFISSKSINRLYIVYGGGCGFVPQKGKLNIEIVITSVVGLITNSAYGRTESRLTRQKCSDVNLILSAPWWYLSFI